VFTLISRLRCQDRSPVPALLRPAPVARSPVASAGFDWWWRVTCLAGCAVLVFGIFYVGEKSVAVGLFPPPVDKAAHFVTYFLMTVLLGFSGLRAFPAALLFCTVGIGALDELHQLYIPGRTGSWSDFGFDVLACVSAVLVLMATRRYSFTSSRMAR
jgi:VanZ family protein